MAHVHIPGPCALLAALLARPESCASTAAGERRVLTHLSVPASPCAQVDWWWEVVVDGCFAMDILLTFRTAVVVDAGERNQQLLITDRSAIAKRYLCSWFLLDTLSTAPLDTVMDLVALSESGSVAAVCGGDAGLYKSVQVLRMLRLIRLLKLFRFLKLGSTIRRLEDQANINPGAHAIPLRRRCRRHRSVNRRRPPSVPVVAPAVAAAAVAAIVAVAPAATAAAAVAAVAAVVAVAAVAAVAAAVPSPSPHSGAAAVAAAAIADAATHPL